MRDGFRLRLQGLRWARSGTTPRRWCIHGSRTNSVAVVQVSRPAPALDNGTARWVVCLETWSDTCDGYEATLLYTTPRRGDCASYCDSYCWSRLVQAACRAHQHGADPCRRRPTGSRGSGYRFEC